MNCTAAQASAVLTGSPGRSHVQLGMAGWQQRGSPWVTLAEVSPGDGGTESLCEESGRQRAGNCLVS